MPTAKRLPSGNYRVRVFSHWEVNEDGKKVAKYESFTAPTKKEAEYMAAEFQLKKKSLSDDRNLTVHDMLTKYVESKENVLSPTTIAGYRQIIRNTFQELRHIRLRDLSSVAVQAAINHEARNLSPKSIRNAYGLLTAALDMFDFDRKLKVTLPKKQKVIQTEFDPRIILPVFVGTEIELPVMLAAWLGLRLSEIRGIKKSDIRDHILTIQRVIVDVDGKPTVKEATKTYDSTRQLVLPHYIESLIPEDLCEDDYIVSLDGYAIYFRFTNALKKAGLPHMRFHDLRHMNAAVMHSVGVPERIAMERGGWVNRSTLEKIYQYTFTSDRVQSDQKVDAYFSELLGI